MPRLIFHSKCSNGHGSQQVFTRPLLARDLLAGRVTFRCDYCGERWSPTVEERVRLRSLAKRGDGLLQC